MTDRRAHYPPCHPAILALAALVAAIQHRCDPFPELVDLRDDRTARVIGDRGGSLAVEQQKVGLFARL